MKKILLKGYYGFGNLGDDLLLLTCSRWLKQLFPEAQLLVATASNRAGYLISFTNGVVENVEPLSPEPQADLVVHGGGGTYYDYQGGNFPSFLLNRVIDLFGHRFFRNGLYVYRRIKGWPANPQYGRIALGVGIGNFTAGSGKYYQKISELNGFNIILPRDNQSFEALSRMNLPGRIIPSSDLAFMEEHWISEFNVHERAAKNIGFILKKWDASHGYIDPIIKVARKLKEQGYSISIFLFEKEHDFALRKIFEEFQIFEWDPAKYLLSEYMQILAKNSIVITSRAHGAIISAALGIPSICIGIEPKLHQIATLFKSSASYIAVPMTGDKLYEMITTTSKIKQGAIQKDYIENRSRLIKSLEEVEQYLKSTVSTS